LNLRGHSERSLSPRVHQRPTGDKKQVSRVKLPVFMGQARPVVSVACSSYAKDDKHTPSGRSPGFWLQTRPNSPSHSPLRTVAWFPGGNQRAGHLPVTVAR